VRMLFGDRLSCVVHGPGGNRARSSDAYAERAFAP
jgi:hypothetical protein